MMFELSVLTPTRILNTEQLNNQHIPVPTGMFDPGISPRDEPRQRPDGRHEGTERQGVQKDGGCRPR